MNIDKEIIKIVYGTINDYEKIFKNTPFEEYDNWKDEIIEKVQDYIKDNYNKK